MEISGCVRRHGACRACLQTFHGYGRVGYTGATASQLIVQNMNKANTDLVNALFLAILSRYPSSGEMSTAMAAIPTASGTPRSQAIQDLAWSLYNKVDFVFNY